ncbi:MAG: Wzz/FepE/Etk N-terminal domain-containing protein [Candidatus Promineifilaceae bacterium]
MEEEIDLRPYVEALLHNWMWIVGTAVLAAIVALAASFLLPPTYEATTLVAVTKPGQLVQFDPRFEAVAETQPLKAYPELATSDELLQELLAEMPAIAPEIDSLETLRKTVTANAGDDPSILRLTVTYRDPQQTAAIANKWAEMFVVQANKVFGNQGGDQLAYFMSQQESAAEELSKAEQALIEFQGLNRASTINNQLAALQSTQANYLGNKQKLTFLLDDVRALREQLSRGSAGTDITAADQLTALFLQLKAFGADSVSPMQLQLDPAMTFGAVERAEQIAFLDGLDETLAARIVSIDQELSALEPQILALQQEKQTTDTASNELTRNYSVAVETYTALARKVEEERITSQDTSSGVRLASRTAVPIDTVGPRKLVNAIVAGLLGFMAAVFIVLVRQWWHSNGVESSTAVIEEAQ